jgi:hypothetical protein
LLSLIITGLFNLLYLIVLLAIIRIWYTMPTFQKWQNYLI